MIQLQGNEKQISWANEVRTRIIGAIASTATPEQLHEVERVTDASWWISIRNHPLGADHVGSLAGAAWLTNNGIPALKAAAYNKVESALRNGGRLEPLKHAIGSMCGINYTHLLTLKNGNRFTVSDHVASHFFPS